MAAGGAATVAKAAALAEAARVREVPRIRVTFENGVEKVWLADPPRSRRIIEGIASTSSNSSLGVSLSSRGCLVQFPMPILSEHGRYEDQNGKSRRAESEGGIGEVIAIAKTKGAVFARAVIYENQFAADRAWALIQSGEVRGFSVSATHPTDGIPVDGIRCFKGWRLRELTVCRRGADHEAFFVPVSCDPLDELPSLEVLRAWRDRQVERWVQARSKLSALPADCIREGMYLPRAIFP